ncbi:ribosome small subunit-dependent GTPase A [Ideonella sp. A 288]|uniref:ribosome small subunit-dependent GTPase A n=1 Tax=Ideonella sp. A 288 TaxID=1962181 RepID=UPI001F22A5DF|nr:ribosome small subunit-dependent GTPase A [Ideonella sp. A 288]
MNGFLDLTALGRLGWTGALSPTDLDRAGADGLRPMRVVEVQRDHLLLHDGHDTHRAGLSRPLAEATAAQHDALAVGDWVLARPHGSPGWLASELLPRHSVVARRTHDGRGGVQRQVLVANVDTAVLVMGLDHDFNLRRLERYLALAQLSGVAAVLMLTKADSLGDGAVHDRLADARGVLPAQVPAFAADGRDAHAAQVLSPWLGSGRTVVLLGSSGAGKSTLTNTLLADQRQDTGPVREDDSRGRHTTTVRTLQLAAQGGCIIDTPGLRALRLDVTDEDDLAATFGDIAQWAERCRFRDCRHTTEPGCAVREAVSPERLRNYHKLLRESMRDSRSALERAAEVAQWKVRHKAATRRAHAKRGD